MRSGPAATGLGALVIAVLVLFPFFGGHVYLLDWVVGGHGPLFPAQAYGLSGGLYTGFLPGLVASALSRLIGDTASLLPYLLFFPLAALGAARLAGPARSVALPAALLFTVNPFVFDRLYAGQIGVLLGYAVLPWATAAALRGPAARGAARLETPVWWAVAALLSVHYLWIVGVSCLAVLLQSRVRRQALTWLAGSVVGVALLSAYLIFAQLGQPRPAAVTAVDLAAYRTQSDPHLGLLGNVAGLYGFWRIGPRLAKQAVPAWPFLLALILLVVIAGAVSGFRDTARRPLSVVLVIAGGGGFVLALGDQGPTGAIFGWLYAHLPLFAVMREPEKFSALLALSYAVFFGWGVRSVFTGLSGHRTAIVVGALLALLPIDYTPTIFDGLGGQVAASTLPASYAEADTLMGHGSGQVLALPWHEYLGFPFTGRVIANPTPTLFDRTVISGDDVELPGVPTTSTSQRSAFLEFVYAHGSQTHEFGSLVAPLGVDYIALSKTVDWQSYGWLNQQRDLVRVLDTPTLSVYRNTEPVDLGHRVTTIVTVANWGALVAMADRVDLATAAVTVTSAAPGPLVDPMAASPAREAPAAGVVRHSAVSYQVPAGAIGYVTLAEPFDPAWRLAGAKPIALAQGGMAFPVGSGAASAHFTHWPVTLFGYLVSGLGGVAALASFLRRSWRASRRKRLT